MMGAATEKARLPRFSLVLTYEYVLTDYRDYIFDISADMFSKLIWLSCSERVKYRKATLVFKCVNGMTPRDTTNNSHHLHRFVKRDNRLYIYIHVYLKYEMYAGPLRKPV